MSALAAGPAAPLFVAAIGITGGVLGLAADLAVARALPQLGGPPPTRVRTTTAAVTALLAALLAVRFGAAWELAAYVFLAVTGVQLSRVDFAHHLLPNKMVATLFLAGGTLLAAAAAFTGVWGDLVRSGASALVLFVVYLVLAIISPNGIGMGDVKLAAPVGLFLGYLGWSQAFYGAALGFVLGGVVTLTLLRLKPAGNLKEVAYGPSMLAATLVVILTLP